METADPTRIVEDRLRGPLITVFLETDIVDPTCSSDTILTASPSNAFPEI